jgi:hypothetical protein
VNSAFKNNCLDLSATRRDLLRTGCCLVCSALAPKSITVAHAAARYFDGCFITPEGYREFLSQREEMHPIVDGLFERNRHFRTTGNASIDRDLDRALGVVADLFSVSPAFGFYDPAKFQGSDEPESSNMNAWATLENTDIPGTRGTVAFGWDLFRKEFYEYDNSGMTIMAIIAHEFGHILQGTHGYLSRIRTGNPQKSEINADFLAGYFLGMRKRRNAALQFRKAGELFIRLGHSAEGNPKRTHGNSQERLDAAEAGFRVAYVENRALADAIRAGLEYVS